MDHSHRLFTHSQTLLTGILLTILVHLLWIYASRYPRNCCAVASTRVGRHLNNYSNLLRSHLLYAPIYILLLVHVLPTSHTVRFRRDTWMWILGTCMLVAVEKLWRSYRITTVSARVTSIAVLPGDMLRLEMEKPPHFRWVPCGEFIPLVARCCFFCCS